MKSLKSLTREQLRKRQYKYTQIYLSMNARFKSEDRRTLADKKADEAYEELSRRGEV